MTDVKGFHDGLLCWIAALPEALAPCFGDSARSHLVLEALGIGHLIHRGLQEDAPPELHQFALLMGNRYAAYKDAGYREVGATRLNIYFQDMWRWWHHHYTNEFWSPCAGRSAGSPASWRMRCASLRLEAPAPSTCALLLRSSSCLCPPWVPGRPPTQALATPPCLELQQRLKFLQEFQLPACSAAAGSAVQTQPAAVSSAAVTVATAAAAAAAAAVGDSYPGTGGSGSWGVQPTLAGTCGSAGGFMAAGAGFVSRFSFPGSSGDLMHAHRLTAAASMGGSLGHGPLGAMAGMGSMGMGMGMQQQQCGMMGTPALGMMPLGQPGMQGMVVMAGGMDPMLLQQQQQQQLMFQQQQMQQQMGGGQPIGLLGAMGPSLVAGSFGADAGSQAMMDSMQQQQHMQQQQDAKQQHGMQGG